MKLLNLILAITLFSLAVNAENNETNNYKQIIRGTVLDAVTKSTLPGANVIVMESNPILGSATDFDGVFRIEQVPVGRVSLYVSSVGYEPKVIGNVIVTSAKEVVLNIELTESVIQLEDVTVKAHRNKQESLNKMAMVSAKTFTVEETSRYAGAFNDAARMVSSYAGVASLGYGNNDIVVRGNSPKGISWRLEDVEIPNPNHFAQDGSTGGPINALNSSMLANSDFFTGAFTAEYGNAFSGVFDMKLRTGNNQKREYMASLGVIGTDLTVEGPFKKGYGGSYLANYRYSSLAMLVEAGLVDFKGVPRYQDMCFNVVLPSKNAGTLSIYGLGGLSGITNEFFTEEVLTSTMDSKTGMGVLGMRHTLPLGEKFYLKNALVTNVRSLENTGEEKTVTDKFYKTYEEESYNTDLKYIVELNGKIDSRNSVKAGTVYTQMFYDMQAKADKKASGVYETLYNTGDNAGMLQLYANWKHRLNERLMFTSGVHYLRFMLNSNYSVEPRAAVKWQFNPQQSISLGGGVHSKVENLSVYFSNIYEGNTVEYQANKNLELTKAAHLVLGYTNQFTENLYLKFEAYYQHLYDVPVKDDPNSPYVLLNETGGRAYYKLSNDGKGRNYGVEMTLERFFANRYYYMLTGSVYEANFKAKDGVWRNSQYNNNFAGNFLFGKEFVLGNTEKGKILNVNTKISYVNGLPRTEIDLQKSIQNRQQEIYWDKYNELRGEGVFNVNLGVSLRINKAKTSHEFKIDIQNLLNSQSTVLEYFDTETQKIVKLPQLAMIPNIMYAIYF